jgi:hypothetical protein
VCSGSHKEGGDFDGTLLDPTLQPGTGSLDVVPGVQYSTRLSRLGADLLLAGSYQLTRANDVRYRFGNEGILTAGLSRALGPTASASLQAKLYRKERSRFAEANVPSTGATVVYVTPGGRLGRAATGQAYAFVQLPVFRRVNETQLAPRFSLLFGISRTFP